MLSFSDDLGRTWTTNPASCGNPQLNDRQTLVTAKPRQLPTVGYPKVVYRCVNQGAYAACATSLDGGLTFGPQVPAWTLPDCNGITGHVEADPEGRVYLPKADCGLGVVVAVTEDDGLTWDLRVVDPTPGDMSEDLDLAVDEAGNLYGVWPRDGQVWFSASRDQGRTWSPARSVTAPGVTATMFQAVAAGAPGRVAIAYLGTTIPGGYGDKPQGVGGLLGGIVGEPDPPEWADATWNAYLAVVTDALSDDPLVQSVTANDPADPLARGLCGGTRCHGMGDFLDVQLDGEGRPWGSFVDVCTAACVTDPSVHWDAPVGLLATLRAGPALRGDAAPLLELPAPAPSKDA